MLNKKMLRIVICLIALFGCSSIGKSQCATDNEVIQTFITYPVFDDVFNPEIPGRIPLYILKNKYINKGLQLTRDDHVVKVVDDTTGLEKNYFEIVRLDMRSDTAQIAFYYELKHLEVQGIVLNDEGKCKVEVNDYIFID
ncbi:MAG TPA: hypothetical protein DD671_17350 [Balneolaceae bacterium]|nr:hypothetical protein [Balneola sp.]HBQ61323.1 hypothetical protein [Balneolaceae bacterium]|tara:strand:+ start:36180 stop:36599 length:420 start_codon:yes stop_codon:yes gene_type:complete